MRGPLYILEPIERRLMLTGVTMIVHGFNSGIGDWVTAMGNAISNADSTPASVYSIIASDGGSSGNPITLAAPTLLSGPQPNATTNADPEIVLLLDWRTMAGTLPFGGHTRSTGDVAAAVATKMIDPNYLPALGGTALAALPMQLIGHSRGASLVNELARDLGHSGIWVDQLTLLDSHPVDGINELFNFNFGDAAMGLPENTIFSDSYWRQDSDQYDFDGEAVAGAHNVQLSESILTGTAGDSLFSHDPNDPGYDLEHSDTHLWYHGTIPPYSNTDGGATLDPTTWYSAPDPSRTTSGYYYSRAIGGTRPADGMWSNDGGAATRQTLTRSGTQWPNIDHLSLRYDNSGTLSTAGQLFLSYRYQDFDSGDTLTLFADQDKNPYNGNAQALSNTQSLASTGAALKFSLYHGSLAGISSSDHYLYAKITDANGQTRFMYLPQALNFTASAPLTNATSGTPNSGSTDSTDFDVYAINASYGGKLSVTMTAPSTPLKSRIGIFDPTGQSLGTNTAASDGGSANLSATALASGVYYVVASSGDGDAGAYSLTIQVDPPITATNPVFDDSKSPQKFSVDFSANVGASLAASDLSVQLLPSGTPFHPQVASFAGSTGTFSFAGVLPDGNYRATLPAGSADDGTAGHLLGADLTADFFVLSADGDRDRVVDIKDFNLLAANFGKSNQTFSQGNYDYSADGVVGITDFNILAANFGKHVDAPMNLQTQPAIASAGIGLSPSPADTLLGALHDESPVPDILL
jgi:hypothetical protein